MAVRPIQPGVLHVLYFQVYSRNFFLQKFPSEKAAPSVFLFISSVYTGQNSLTSFSFPVPLHKIWIIPMVVMRISNQVKSKKLLKIEVKFLRP